MPPWKLYWTRQGQKERKAKLWIPSRNKF